MKKILLLLLLFTGILNAQIINIPDAVFKAKLLSASSTIHVASNVNPNSSATPNVYTAVDTNGNGEIEVSEAQAIVFLNVTGSAGNGPKISNLEGLQYFTNLKYFRCNNNTLTTLDVSSNLALIELNCSTNPLTSINFNNPNLTFFTCGTNLLTTLNLQGCPGLQWFSCGANNLTSISFANNPLLKSIGITNNPLTSINVNSLQNLELLAVNYSNMTSVNINNLPNLLSVNFGFNSLLTNIELVNLPHCYKVNVQNSNISSIDLSTVAYMQYINSGLVMSPAVYEIKLNNNLNLNYVNFKNGFANPQVHLFTSNLNDQPQHLCKDETDVFSFVGYNTGTLISSYCNFTPGGLYNTITGNMRFDNNNNGCDASDAVQSNIQVNINDGTNQGSVSTNSSGNYSLFTQAGNFTLTPNVENPTFFNFSPTSITIPFANNNNNSTTQNFCISANGVHNDVEVLIVPLTTARPGFDATYKIIYKNKGNQILSGNVSLTYNDLVLDFVSATSAPTTQNSGILNWNYTNLHPFENRSHEVSFNINSPLDNPPVTIGDVLNFSIDMTVAGDENPLDNMFTYNQIVVGSLDPNDKTCLEGNIVSPTKIGDYLHYNINFENTGTAAATFIVVKDVIDTTKFDINSLQIINSSHPMTTRITGNIVEFIFQNINLAAGQHGNVAFKIKTKSTLVVGNTVTNSAGIYFDYNFPVITNTASTTFQTLSNSIFEADNSILVYPNPSADIINIKGNFTLKSIQLYDVQGRLLQTSIENSSNAIIDISQKSNGVYFLKITSENGSKVEKIVKE